MEHGDAGAIGNADDLAGPAPGERGEQNYATHEDQP
jgi:hypothetical protein